MTSRIAPSLFAALLFGAGFGTGCGDGDAMPQPTQVELAGAWFYPESITADSAGNLYVGSVATGEVARVAAGTAVAETFIAPGDPTNVTGVLADSASSTLWVCSVNFTGAPTELRAYDLADASLVASYPMAAGFCTDLVLDAGGNLYVTDSATGSIQKLPPGGGALAVWLQDALLAPAAPGGFGANGIVIDPQGDLIVTNQQKGTLVRAGVAADGSSEGATEIPVTPALTLPDGMRIRSDGSLLVVEGRADTDGRLMRVTLSGATGTASVIADGLRFPTSVIEAQGSLWVSEGQLDELLKTLQTPPGTPEPVLPFLVKRISAE
jgi:sugar lactone lactonase YvrE